MEKIRYRSCTIRLRDELVILIQNYRRIFLHLRLCTFSEVS